GENIRTGRSEKHSTRFGRQRTGGTHDDDTANSDDASERRQFASDSRMEMKERGARVAGNKLFPPQERPVRCARSWRFFNLFTGSDQQSPKAMAQPLWSFSTPTPRR